MNKQAKLRAGVLLNGMFATQQGVAGVKKGVNEMKNPAPAGYDKILKNDKFSVDKKTGAVTTVTASDALDNMYNEKVAADYESIKDDMKSDVYFYKDYNPKDDKKNNKLPAAVGGAITAAMLANGIAHGNALKPFKDVGQGAADFAKKFPALFSSKYRSGRIGFKAFRKGVKGASQTAKKATNPKKEVAEGSGIFLKGLGVGAGVGTGNLAIHMLGDKYFNNKRTVKNSYDSIQEPVSQVYHQRQRDRAKQRREANKYTDNRRKGSPGYYRREFNRPSNTEKSAFEILDDLHMEKTALKDYGGAKGFFKTVLKEDVLQNSVRSLPYFLAPLGVSLAINKDLRSDGRPLRTGKQKKLQDNKIVIEVPNHLVENPGMAKKASVNFMKRIRFAKKAKGAANDAAGVAAAVGDKYKGVGWDEFLRHDMPRNVVRALTWSLPITALTAVTGRNLRGRGEKINSNGTTPGKTRITIETAPNAKDYDYGFAHQASEELEALYKEAMAKKGKKKRRKCQ